MVLWLGRMTELCRPRPERDDTAMVAKIVARDGVRDARDGNVERFHSSPKVEATDTIDTLQDVGNVVGRG
jgi:hypothetical protein